MLIVINALCSYLIRDIGINLWPSLRNLCLCLWEPKILKLWKCSFLYSYTFLSTPSTQLWARKRLSTHKQNNNFVIISKGEDPHFPNLLSFCNIMLWRIYKNLNNIRISRSYSLNSGLVNLENEFPISFKSFIPQEKRQL